MIMSLLKLSLNCYDLGKKWQDPLGSNLQARAII